MTENEKRAQLAAKWRKAKKEPPPSMPETALSPQAPAPALAGVIQERGTDLVTQALSAWQKRRDGVPIVSIAHEMGVTIEVAKGLMREAYDAVVEDLASNLNQNRQLDLERTDLILEAFLPGAKQADRDSALVVLKALAHRSHLTGTDGSREPGARQSPGNVLIWIQQQLPAINRIVDQLPVELER